MNENNKTTPLKERLRNWKEDEERIRIIPLLMLKNDITQPDVAYHVTTFAKSWFKENSNIEDVVEKYLELTNKTDACSDTWMSVVIRGAISNEKTRSKYPHSIFKFNSSQGESIGKVLLMYPNIKSKENLEEVIKFQNDLGLKSIEVVMYNDNRLDFNARKYIEEKRAKYGTDNVSQSNAMDYGMRQYYEEHKLVVDKHIDELTFEDLLQISTFEKVFQKAVKLNKIPDGDWDSYRKRMFEYFLKTPSGLLNDSSFYVYSKYNLITNRLTKEQEFKVTRDIKKFYDLTNARDILIKEKRKFSQEGDNNLSDKERSDALKKRFFLAYLRKQNKKVPPFNHLEFFEDEDDPKIKPAVAVDPVADTIEFPTESQKEEYIWALEHNVTRRRK